MIKLSDIRVTTSSLPELRGATVVTAHFEHTEEMTISPHESRRYPDILSKIKTGIPGRLLDHVYAGLREPLRELEGIALQSEFRYQRARELIGQIHEIMEGRG